MEVIIGVGGGCGGLLGEPLVRGAGGVEVGFGSLGPDAQCAAGLFEYGEAGVGGGVQLVAARAGRRRGRGRIPRRPGHGRGRRRGRRLPDHPVTVDPPVRGAGQAIGVKVERPLD